MNEKLIYLHWTLLNHLACESSSVKDDLSINNFIDWLALNVEVE